MVAPFMDARLGTSKSYARLWQYVLGNAGFSEGDVFCLQDSMCVGGIREKDLAVWFSDMKSAVDTVPGVKFWADMETFDISDWTALSLDTLYRRMKLLEHIVDGYMTFSYTHYYSPNVTSEGFQRSFLHLVENGAPEKIPPVVSDAFDAEFDGEKVHLSWGEGYDNMGILGYLLYRDGRLIATIKEGTRGSTSSKGVAKKEYTDTDIVKNREYIYELRCFDFSGNISDKARIILNTSVSGNGSK